VTVAFFLELIERPSYMVYELSSHRITCTALCKSASGWESVDEYDDEWWLTNIVMMKSVSDRSYHCQRPTNANNKHRLWVTRENEIEFYHSSCCIAETGNTLFYRPSNALDHQSTVQFGQQSTNYSSLLKFT